MMASAAAICATRRARNPVVLANSGTIDFVAPVPTGSVVEAHASVEHVGRSSLVVEAVLQAEQLLTGDRRRACNARFIFVSVDGEGTPTPVASYDDPTLAAPRAEGVTETTELVLPGNANGEGRLLGGEVLRLLDAVAFVAASRHAREPLVTARSEQTDFHASAAVGDLISLSGSVTEVRTTSLVVDVDVTAEDPLTGEVQPCTRGRFVFAPARRGGSHV